MKKTLLKILILCMVICSVSCFFIACGKNVIKFELNFVVDGEIYKTIDTSGDEIISIPENPIKDGYDFDGWFWDKDVWENPFTAYSLLNAPLTSDMSVYAKFKPKHVHEYTEQTIKSPTCTEKGEIIFICLCGDKYTEETSPAGHIPDVAVEKNRVEAGCEEAGHYDLVVYCSVCGEELSREYMELSATGHKYNEEYSFNELYHWYDVICGHTIHIPLTHHNIVDGVCTECGFEQDKLSFKEIDEGTAYEVTGMLDGVADLTIPTTHNGKPVTKISEEAFAGRSSLKSVTIPDSIIEIGYAAFSGCSSLVSMTIPFVGARRTALLQEAVFGYIFGASYYNRATQTKQTCRGASGGYSSFYYYIPSTLKSVAFTGTIVPFGGFSDCSGLTSITFTNKLQTIELYAFEGCSNLKEIIIPDSVTLIKSCAFSGCSSLVSMTIPFVGASRSATGSSAVFGSIFGTDYYTGATGTKQFDGDGYGYCYIPSTLRSVTVTGTSISSYGFNNCSKLTSITFSNKLQTIKDHAFSGCSNLKDIIIPDSVTSIGNHAFSGCSSLQEVIIPNSVLSIGARAFYNCTSIKRITIPFVGASKSAKGDNAKFEYIFDKSDYHSDGTITSYVPYSLTDVVITGGNSIVDYAFRNCSRLINITLPDSLTSIGSHAFDNCSRLINITLPDSLTSIGSYAFYNCSELNSVKFENTSNWWVKKDGRATKIDKSEISDLTAAATCLTSTYLRFEWMCG